MTITNNSWDALIQREKEKEYLNDLDWALAREYKTKKIYPPKGQIFEALKKTPKENVKVVILGQDPYHNMGQKKIADKLHLKAACPTVTKYWSLLSQFVGRCRSDPRRPPAPGPGDCRECGR